MKRWLRFSGKSIDYVKVQWFYNDQIPMFIVNALKKYKQA